MTEIPDWVYLLGILQLGILLLGILPGIARKFTGKFAQDFHRILRLWKFREISGWSLNKFFSRIRRGMSRLITLISLLLEKHTRKKSNAPLREEIITYTKKIAQRPSGGAGGGIV
jgi:hypothetical protein